MGSLELYEIPEAMKGAPVAQLSAGLLTFAFTGFIGLIAVPWYTEKYSLFAS